ncbi:MAG: EamA family transporter [archaeon]
MEWFIFSIFATVMFGIQSFLYKGAMKKGCDKFVVTLSFMITVAFFALILFLFEGITFTNLLITFIIGLIFAIAFYSKTIIQMKALQYLPTNKVFPITSSEVILVIFFALVFFKEVLEFYQILGVALIIIAVTLIHGQSKKQKDYSKSKKGFLFAFLSIPFGATVVISNKFASLNSETGFFILVSYILLILISFVSYEVVERRNAKKAPKRDSIKMGLLIGVVNFAGFFSFLSALEKGPLSLVAAIHPNFVVVTVILARIVYKEELSLKQFSLVLLSVIGVILLRI